MKTLTKLYPIVLWMQIKTCHRQMCGLFFFTINLYIFNIPEEFWLMYTPIKPSQQTRFLIRVDIEHLHHYKQETKQFYPSSKWACLFEIKTKKPKTYFLVDTITNITRKLENVNKNQMKRKIVIFFLKWCR